MNLIRMLGWDTYQITAVVLWGVAVVSAIFPVWYWKKNIAWKKEKGAKTTFFEIWRPTSLFGTVLFILLGFLFWYLQDIITAGQLAAAGL